MSTILSLTGQPPKLFQVVYCVEQGYAITVEAASAEDAEALIRKRLDDECDVLDGSHRVPHVHDTVSVEEVAP